MLRKYKDRKDVQKYIKDVAKLVKYVGLPSAKENVVYIHALMELGYFAKQMEKIPISNKRTLFFDLLAFFHKTEDQL